MTQAECEAITDAWTDCPEYPNEYFCEMDEEEVAGGAMARKPKRAARKKNAEEEVAGYKKKQAPRKKQSEEEVAGGKMARPPKRAARKKQSEEMVAHATVEKDVRGPETSYGLYLLALVGVAGLVYRVLPLIRGGKETYSAVRTGASYNTV